MAVSLKKARDYVYGNGVMWERALFAYLFEEGPLDRVHQCLMCYKNSDGGWAHGMEHDAKTPDSHPLALEFLLTKLRITGIPVGHLLDGTPEWIEQNRQPDGSLKNPASLLDYPHAPWWNEGGQTAPDSIVGHLIRFGVCPPSLAESTRAWVATNLTLAHIRANEWLFMAYHAHDYFMHVDDFPGVDTYRQATIQNIIACAEKAPEKQYYVLFNFAPSPESAVAQALPPDLLQRHLDYIAANQREDGGWDDEHGLPQWYPVTTILNLLALRRYGKL